ncbi:MAG: hypothetical protein KID00_12420 [Clostridium argentinense]|nr:hypothetical protein [Clostridium argentinense]
MNEFIKNLIISLIVFIPCFLCQTNFFKKQRIKNYKLTKKLQTEQEKFISELENS